MLKIFSTYTKDIIHNNDTNSKTIKFGGPAFFVGKIFRRYKIDHKIIFQKAIIDIKIENRIESGIQKNALNTKIATTGKNDKFVVISTVGKEWVPGNNIPKETIIFLDIQGYVRSFHKSDKIYKNNFWDSVACLKGTKEEIRKVAKRIIENQKKKCLIVTDGDNGSSIFFNNKKYVFKPRKIKPKDTIGAGDTFFANFIICFMKTNGDIIKSGNFATKQTVDFLIKKS